jgi:hypothetical protein
MFGPFAKKAGQRLLLAVVQIRVNLAAKWYCRHGSKHDTAALTAMHYCIALTQPDLRGFRPPSTQGA